MISHLQRPCLTLEARLNQRQNECMQVFLDLIDSEPICGFLREHQEFDKYYLACVFVYFQRARMHVREYNPRKFALALHIVNAMKASCAFLLVVPD